jgi:hypothetical protein
LLQSIRYKAVFIAMVIERVLQSPQFAVNVGPQFAVNVGPQFADNIGRERR